MPFNLLKKYPELLEILHLGDKERKASLYRVYRRDIEDNEAFKFREKRVYPIKSDGEIDMQREFMHLTTTDDKEAEGAATKKRVFEPDRSRRLHWIRHHIEERTSHVLEIFSCEERDMKHRKNIYRTYVYDTAEKYVIVLEPQRSPYGILNSEIIRNAFTVFAQYSPTKTSSLLSLSLQSIMLAADISPRTSEL